MSIEQPWILPDGVDELLPNSALKLEHLRRLVLAHFQSWGYELVFPPLLEYVDSLTVGAGHDLQIQTYQVVDHLSGRAMGFRPDMTMQVTRMDARHLSHKPVSRLCYCGSILRARPAMLDGKRAQVQAGVELFGHSGFESDVEIIALMLETLAVSGFEDLLLDVGHAGVIEAALSHLNLPSSQREGVVDILSRKSGPDLNAFADLNRLSIDQKKVCIALMDLHGPRPVLEQALKDLVPLLPAAEAPLLELISVADRLSLLYPDLALYFDLGELRGLDYHTGLIFAAYEKAEGAILAKGGRYDGVGAVYGASQRPAIGFSVDLLHLVALGVNTPIEQPAIYVPDCDEPDLLAFVRQLRLSGERVIQALPGLVDCAKELGCDRVIRQVDGHWQVSFLE